MKPQPSSGGGATAHKQIIRKQNVRIIQPRIRMIIMKCNETAKKTAAGKEIEPVAHKQNHVEGQAATGQPGVGGRGYRGRARVLLEADHGPAPDDVPADERAWGGGRGPLPREETAPNGTPPRGDRRHPLGSSGWQVRSPRQMKSWGRPGKRR